MNNNDFDAEIEGLDNSSSTQDVFPDMSFSMIVDRAPHSQHVVALPSTLGISPTPSPPLPAADSSFPNTRNGGRGGGRSSSSGGGGARGIGDAMMASSVSLSDSAAATVTTASLTESDLLEGVRPRRVQVWTPDDAVTECHKCHVTFGWLTRRHHCRACGRIFCFQCCARLTKLPRDLVRYPEPLESDSPTVESTVGAERERVCEPCYRDIKRIRPVCALVRQYDKCGYDVVQLTNEVAREGDEAREAVLLSLSTFREIQYHLPSCQTLSERERAMLRRNQHLLCGHGAWAVPLLQAGCKIDLQSERTVTCRSMMCTRYCEPRLSEYDALYILSHFANVDQGVLQQCTEALQTVSTIWLPHLTFALRVHPTIVTRIIMRQRAARANIFWMLRMWIDQAKHEKRPAVVSVYERALQQFCDDKSLQDGAHLVRLMMCDDRHGVRALAEVVNDAILPALPYPRRCADIDTSNCEVKRSATRPTTYPIRLDDDTRMKILVKREDVRSDLIMMNAVHYMVGVLESEEGLDLGVVTYNVMPTSIDGGFIEMVDGASTLYDVQHRLRKSVFKYIVESNDSEPARDVRARFVRSTAAYCVITYLLGVGDRHLENIMVTRDGRLFHIDYGFVLGADPKPMAAPVMRISPGMVEAIGDVGSQQYLEFEALCTRIYNALRRHVRPISMMLSLLVDMGITTRETLDQHVMRRFAPGENTVQAQLQLSKRIEGSRTSYSQSAIDISHHQAHVVSQASGYVGRPLRRAFGTFESWYWGSSGMDLSSPGTSPS